MAFVFASHCGPGAAPLLVHCVVYAGHEKKKPLPRRLASAATCTLHPRRHNGVLWPMDTHSSTLIRKLAVCPPPCSGDFGLARRQGSG
ncbi:hypothetical protein GGP41_009075 [Bipolaris sorokiniana]|uniref:Uncharacterized protein n=1 Tax=Cochliobolus sativus TaxID=45130 RepID=A0A8H5ZEK7_COCSA|nr:hypothetical protein GGP41_009075 [Bipolaris sorokiniana]